MAEHVMENEFLRVTVSDHGAELVSVWDKERKTERIWQADPAVWNRHAPVLFPFVGKVNGRCLPVSGQKLRDEDPARVCPGYGVYLCQ